MIGCCSSLDNIKLLKENDFDFIEIKASELEKVPTVKKYIDIYAINNLLPRNLSIFKDLEIIKQETERIFKLAKNHNVKIVTFGSGTCRKKIFDVDWKGIFDDYLNYLNFLSKKYLIKVGIEPLAKEETDLINNIEEAEYYINKYDNLGITLDSYHFFKNDKNFESIKNNIKKIVHFHISDDDRSFPINLSNQNLELVHLLRDLQYNGAISIEIDWRKELKINSSIVNNLKKEIQKC